MSSIYSAIFQAGRPYTLSGHWRGVPSDPAFFCLPADPAPLLAELRGQFTDTELLHSGVVVETAEGSGEQAVQWHPSLVAKDVPLWSIRTQPEAEPSQLIAEMCTVGQKTWPLITALEDCRQQALIAEADGYLAVAYSMPDLAILRSVGIAAVPGGNWCPLTKSQLGDFCRSMGISAALSGPYPGSAEPSKPAQEPVLLTLINWSLATMDRAPLGAATATWSHLMKLNEHLGLEFESFGCWSPPQKVINLLAHQALYLDVPQIRTSLLASMERDSLAIDAARNAKPTPAKTIANALRAWRRAEGDAATSPAARKQALDFLCELNERQRFTPLVEEAQQAQSPVERNAEMALAEIGRLQQPQLLLTEKLRRKIGEHGMKAEGMIPTDELKQLFGLIDRQLQLTEVILTCRTQRPRKPVPPHKPGRPKPGRAKPSQPASSPATVSRPAKSPP